MSDANRDSQIPKWSDITASDDYQQADWETKQAVRARYFDKVVRPNTPSNVLDDVQGEFFTRTERDVFGDREQREEQQLEEQAPARDFSYRGANVDRQALEEDRDPVDTSQPSAFRDIGNLLAVGSDRMALNVRELTRRTLGDGVVDFLDGVDEYLNGESSKELLEGRIESNEGQLSDATTEAREKAWWDSERNRPGPAWSDPRSYMAGVAESAPETLATMAPSMLLSRAAYGWKIARGASRAEAAKTAATTATLAGSLSEGLLGGAQSSREVRDTIQNLDPEILQQSDAIQALMDDGYTLEEARDTLSEDASTQAFVTSGVITGAFGGLGDRALAQVLSGPATNPVSAAVRGAIGEGVFEEMPQEAGQQASENWSVGLADNRVGLLDNVPNAAAGGLALGSTMGAGMGAVGGSTNTVQPVLKEDAIQAARQVTAQQGGDSLDQAMAGQQAEQAVPDPSPQPQADPQEGTPGSFISQPRSSLDDAGRERRDSLVEGEEFQNLRQTAERRGDTQAVAELDAIAQEAGAAFETETLARTRGDREAMGPLQERLSDLGRRYDGVVSRLSGEPQAAPQQPQQQGGLLSGAMTDITDTGPQVMPEQTETEQPAFTDQDAMREWERLWREQGVENPAEGDFETIEIQPGAPETDATEQAGARIEQEQQDAAGETITPGPIVTEQQDDDPGSAQRVPTERIQIDPEAYQFRTDVDQESGTDSRLEGVQQWDDYRAGNVLIHEREDGSLFVADGHHRVRLAQQLDQPVMNAQIVRERDGVTVQDARRMAAENNIANDSATPLDVAKVFRDKEGSEAEIIAEANLPPRSTLARDGIAISRLGDEAFGAAVNGQLDEKNAAVIGRTFSDPAEQLAAVGVFQRANPTNDTQRTLLANEIRNAGFNDSQGDQLGMFGDDPAESLIGDRVRVLDNLRGQLVRDRRLFASLNRNAPRAEAAGNQINTEANQQQSDQSARAIDLLGRVSTDPDLNQAVNESARQVRDGEPMARVVDELKTRLTNGRQGEDAPQGDQQPADGRPDVRRGQEPGRGEQGAQGDADGREGQAEPGAPDGQSPRLSYRANGKPFATERSARASGQFRDNPGADVVPDGDGFAIRPAQAETQESAPASDIRGEQIDDEWTAFSDDSGTRGVPRTSMPQVKAEHRGALANFLNARGIESAEDTVPAGSLQPTQAEFSEAKVRQAKERTGGDRAILVSADGHILDGHHQWMARRDQGEDVRVIRLDAPIDQLVDEIQEFPSSELEGEQEAAQAPGEEADTEQGAAQDDPRYRATPEQLIAHKEIDALARRASEAGVPVVAVINEDGLPARVRNAIERDGVQGRVKGVYYNRTIWVISANTNGVADATATILHEGAHLGIRNLMGSDFGRVLDNIYRDMPRAWKDRLEREYAGQLRNQSPEAARRTVAEEYLAHLAETDPQASLLDRAVSAIRMWIRRVFGQSAAREWGRKEVVDLIQAANRASGLDAVTEGGSGEIRYALRPGVENPGSGVEQKNKHGFEPSLRVKVPLRGMRLPKKAGILAKTNLKNVDRQLAALDEINSKFPDAHTSLEKWARMEAFALASQDVPVPPYAFISDINSDAAVDKVASLSEGQVADADHGFRNAAAFREAYINGDLSEVTTGKLFMWSFLSRGVSPYVQESLFIDAFDGIDYWIKKAAAGDFTEADLPDYLDWSRTAAPAGSGQPGAGAGHNLNAFGKNWLMNMAKRDEDGVSTLAKLHGMMSDPEITGPEIRREYHRNAQGTVIDNKVASFTLLVAGFDDVMVLDRVQIRQLWDDGRFGDRNLYDGRRENKKPVAGSALNDITFGVRGLMIYEALERGLAAKVPEIYAAAGRPEAASIGRYHWDTWVSFSQQEASHGTLDAILADGSGEPNTITSVTAKEGEYGAYEYGARYGRDGDGSRYFDYTLPSGGSLRFDVPSFRSFLGDIKKAANGVVPDNFRVGRSGNAPWYRRPEVNQQRLEEIAWEYAEGPSPRKGAEEGAGALRRSDENEESSDGSDARFRLERGERQRRFAASRPGRTGNEGSRGFQRRSPAADRRERGVLATFEPTPEFQALLDESELGSATLEELEPTRQNALRFSQAITRSKRASKHSAAVYVYPLDEYREMRMFMTPDGGSGLAVKSDGDIVSVFSDGGGKVHAMITLATEQGGTKLDAFRTVLPYLYQVNGFREVDSAPWDEQYKPEGWRYEDFAEFQNGRPDVVFMEYDPAYNPFEEEPRYSLGDRNEGRPESARDRAGRDRGREKAPLEGAPTVRGAAGPDPELNRVAEQYAQEQEIDLRRQAEYADVDVDRAERIAQAYADMEHAPQDPRVQEAYQNLIRQTRAQYDALVDAGYEFFLFDGDGAPDPYDTNPWNAMRDLRANKRMAVFSTEAGFSSDDTVDVSNNPLLEDTGLRWPLGEDGPLVKVLANDLFRAVHDAFGHGLEGAGFRARGEENAWQAHARLFTGSALGALTSETRGQNSWLNFGPMGEHNRTAGLFDTVFADQKTGLMPEWTWTEGVADSEPRYSLTDTPEFRRWFGDSKVVDDNGEPLVVYHGTNLKFTEFAGDRVGSRDAGFFGSGFYFTPDEVDAESYAEAAVEDNESGEETLIDAYLSLKNPFVWDMTAEGQDATIQALADMGIQRDSTRGDSSSLSNTEERRRFNGGVRERGHDGVLVVDEDGVREAVAFSPNQIKSASDNTGAFDSGINDIRYNLAPPADSPEFKRWFGDSQVVDDSGQPMVAYHSTRADFTEFRPGSFDVGIHFGTMDAADNRLEGTRNTLHVPGEGMTSAQGENIMPAYLSIKNPLRVEDPGIFSVEDPQDNAFAMELRDKGVRAREGMDTANLTKAIEDAGYDGLVYENESETGQSWVALRPEQVKSAFNRGTWDSGESDIRYNLVDQEGQGYTGRDSTNFSLPDETLIESALRVMADKMRPLNRLQGAITESGGRVNDDNDTYLAEELFHGKSEFDLRRFERRYVEPLADALVREGVDQAELDSYLYARHAPERNRVIANRNPDNEGMQDGGSGMTDAQAEEVMELVDRQGKRGAMERLAAVVDDMLALRRDAIRQGGLETDESLDAWDEMYDYYVPLKGWANDEDVPVGEDGAGRPRTGRGFDTGGREAKTALGRKSMAASPSTQAIVDTVESQIRKRKNEVGQALLSLVTDNPNPRLWEAFTRENPDTQHVAERRVDPETGDTRIEVVERPASMEMSDRYFKTKKNGQTFYIKIHDQRLMNAMRNVGPEQNGLMIRAMSSVVRVMSSLVTSYNPEFMVTNFARDVQTALLNLSAEQSRNDGRVLGERIVKDTLRDIPAAMRGAYRGLSDKPAREGDAGEWDRWFNDFQADGAKTGYFDMKDLEAQAKEIRKLMVRAQGGVRGNLAKWRKAVADFVEGANGAVENGVRLSAYANARRSGVTRKRAASLAKNMTVNFNRRGELGTLFNSLYMFFNASVQGTANFARTMGGLKEPMPGKSPHNYWARLNTAQKLGIGMAAGSFALAALNRMLSDEDDDEVKFWDKIPDHEKERNLILMTGDENYVKVPLPYGYNVFSVIGTNLEEVMYGPKTGTEAAKDLSLAILGSFNPIGFEESDDAANLVVKNMTPTLFRSIAQIAVNEDFAGRPIYKEDFEFAVPTPDSSRSFRSTPEAYKSFAEFLNEATRGSKQITGGVDVSPDTLQHLVNYYGGGAWGFTEKVADAGVRMFSGEEIERYRVPFAGRVMSSVSEYGDQSTFYDRYDELGQISEHVKAQEGRARLDAIRENRDAIGLFERAKDLRKYLSDTRKLRDRAEANERLSEERRKELVERYEERMNQRIDRFNKDYNEKIGQ